MTIEIKHRDTGVVLHTVNAETLRGADLSGANLSKAYLPEANLREADLTGANLRRANLTEADLIGAKLIGADLSGANLRGANLRGAYLYGADLTGAYLSGATMGEDKLNRLLARATRSDGFEFFLFALQAGLPKIKAGCRWMTIDDYRAHVAKHYPDTDKARETLDILNFFEARAR